VAKDEKVSCKIGSPIYATLKKPKILIGGDTIWLKSKLPFHYCRAENAIPSSIAARLCALLSVLHLSITSRFVLLELTGIIGGDE